MPAEQKKRDNIWWIALLAISSVLIVAIGGFFIFRLFTANPMEGKWISEEEGITMVVRPDQTVKLLMETEDGDVTVKLPYDIDKETKSFTVYSDTEESYYQNEILDHIEGSYLYSIEGETLTLTESEYGEQMSFVRK